MIYGPVVDASEGIISQSQTVMCNKRSGGRGSIFLAPGLLLGAGFCADFLPFVFKYSLNSNSAACFHTSVVFSQINLNTEFISRT